MNVSLTPELEKFVENELSSGLYGTASEVVRAGLRLLKEERDIRRARTPHTLEELEQDLLRAAESLDAGEGEDGRVAIAALRKKIQARRHNG